MNNENADTIRLGHLTANLRTSNRSVEEAVSEIDRELSVRVRCFGRWVDDRKLSAIDAKDRLERLVAAYHFLCVLLESQQNKKVFDSIAHPAPQVSNLTPDELPALTSPGE